MNELALFAGAGGGMLGGKLLGWRNVGAVEIGKYQRGVIAQRQNDGQFDPAPIWDDVTTFRDDNAECAIYFEDVRSVADELAISGGFPCQDISIAGGGDGLEGLRSGLWREMARIIGEIRPAFVLVENSPELTHRGGVRVVGDLARLGYDMRWGVMGAHEASAPHFRDRIWILAHAQRLRRWKFSDPSIASGRPLCSALRSEGAAFLGSGGQTCSSGSDTDAAGFDGQTRDSLGKSGERRLDCSGLVEGGESSNRWYEREPGLARLVNGVANRTQRLNASGNGQVPAVVRLAWETLKP